MQYETRTITQPDGSIARLTYPVWDTFRPSAYLEALETLLARGRAEADVVAGREVNTFEQLIGAEFSEALQKITAPAEHLNAVLQTDELRMATEKGDALISAFFSDIATHEGLYKAYERFEKSEAFAALSSSRKKIITDTILNFRLGGAGLTPEKKERLKVINADLVKLGFDFTNHTMDAMEPRVWMKHIPPADIERVLAGIPETFIESLKRKAKELGRDGAVVTLLDSVVSTICQFADDRDLRREVWIADNDAVTEISSDPSLDNTPLIRRILALRDEKAKLLGFANYAEYSMAKKMLKSPAEVFAFLDRIRAIAYTRAKEEFERLKAFAHKELGIETLEPWDVAYIMRKMRIAECDVSPEEVRKYFPSSKVFEGLMLFLERVFGMSVMRDPTIPVWKEGVMFYRLYDEHGYLRGGFYADLYAREKKRGGAWMDTCMRRLRYSDGTIQLPISYLNCNFNEPAEGEADAYLYHSDIITIFHEFGHNAHLLFGVTDDPDSDMAAVEWDAIEFPSQIMEYWCWDASVLKAMSAHKDTGAAIPRELCEKLAATKHYLAAMATVRQLEFAYVDMRLHAEYDPKAPRDPYDVLQEVRASTRVTPVYPRDRFLNNFTHIFDGGYAAGYWSYKWAEVFAADAFEAFEETGNIFDRTIGCRLRDEVFAVGSSRPMLESFIAFRGRKPDPDALLRQTGLAEKRSQ